MKIYKKTIICMSIACITFLLLGIVLEYKIIPYLTNYVKEHNDFYINISIGAFCSGLLVLIPAIVGYLHEKNLYYFNIYSILNKLLFNSINIINYTKDYEQNKQIVSNSFESISLTYNDLVSCYSRFTYFFFFNEKDKLIESIICEETKYFKLLEKILELSTELQHQKIEYKTYEISFNIIRDEFINTYKTEFSGYQKLVDKDMKCIIVDKKLKTYIK